MLRVYRTRQYESDALEIWTHIAKHNADAADKLIRRFEQKAEMLSQSPGIGAKRTDLGRDLRCLPVGYYLLFYRQVHDGIELVRVLHGSRDILTQFHH